MSDDKQRTRFSAVIEELTGPTEPATKVELKAAVPEFAITFPYVVKVRDGVPSTCPKCDCAVYTPLIDLRRSQGGIAVMCRACPLPPPVYQVELETWTALAVNIKTNPYRCGQCNKNSMVSIAVDRVNLYCEQCRTLTIHGAVTSFPLKAQVDDAKTFAELLGFRPSTRDVDTSTFFRGNDSDDELRERVNARLLELRLGMVTATESRNLSEWNNFDARPSRRSEDRFSFSESIGRRTSWQDRIRVLADRFYDILDLLPAEKWAINTRLENVYKFNAKPRDVVRRTGRTTRGLLEALAEVVLKSAGRLFVRGSSATRDKMHVQDAWDFYKRLGLRVAEPLHTVSIMPLNARDGWRVTDNEPDAVVFVDHHFDEINALGRR
jgi:hypothetical protein